MVKIKSTEELKIALEQAIIALAQDKAHEDDQAELWALELSAPTDPGFVKGLTRNWEDHKNHSRQYAASMAQIEHLLALL